MKCKDCRSCTKVVRIDFESHAILYHYCKLCGLAWTIAGKNEVIEEELMNKIVENYKKVYGDVYT